MPVRSSGDEAPGNFDERFGVSESDDRPTTLQADSEEHQNRLARLTVDYFVESAIMMADLFQGDYLQSVIYLAITRENLKALEQLQQLTREALTPDPPSPEGRVKPVSVYSISKILGLSYETTRRHIARLIAEPDYVRAEFAVLVRSDLKGKGLGWVLMEHLIAYARAEGLGELNGQVLATNVTMLKMCSELGFEIDASDSDLGLRIVRLRLERAPV